MDVARKRALRFAHLSDIHLCVGYGIVDLYTDGSFDYEYRLVGWTSPFLNDK